ncbi:hypothetical protein GUJ93_ZPchr0009g1508 [Zizania palustris]|uniref:Uncharacterized protein n=1 Tax=Zizania palustris TaxID=103762 RepID=A0A8J5R429_ZIZPA|nr:hypothetical protein GUJ93_ZPchr0009g1508 [Zizania palustris]
MQHSLSLRVALHARPVPFTVVATRSYATPFANFIKSRPSSKPPFGSSFIIPTLISSKLSILKIRRFSTLKIV